MWEVLVVVRRVGVVLEVEEVREVEGVMRKEEEGDESGGKSEVDKRRRIMNVVGWMGVGLNVREVVRIELM